MYEIVLEVENEDYEYDFYVDAKTGDTFLDEKKARDDDWHDDDDDNDD